MKSAPLLSALSIALCMPLSLFAASGSASVTSVDGSASRTVEGVVSPLSAGDPLSPGNVVEVGSGSSLEIQLPGGGVVQLGPNTTVRLRTIEVSTTPDASSVGVVLLRGSLSGSGGSSFNVRTTAGVAYLGSSQFSVIFTPGSPTTGTMTVVVSTGAATVLPMNGLAPISVPPLSQVTVGTNISIAQVQPASPSALAATNVNTPSPKSPGTPPSGPNTGGIPNPIPTGVGAVPNVTVTTAFNPVTRLPLSSTGEGTTL